MRHDGWLYVLRGREVVSAEDVLSWGRWFATHDRQVARTRVGSFDVSTVFIGIHYGHLDERPIVFETMVSPTVPALADFTRRYATWEEAEAGHALTVSLLQAMHHSELPS